MNWSTTIIPEAGKSELSVEKTGDAISILICGDATVSIALTLEQAELLAQQINRMANAVRQEAKAARFGETMRAVAEMEAQEA